MRSRIKSDSAGEDIGHRNCWKRFFGYCEIQKHLITTCLSSHITAWWSESESGQWSQSGWDLQPDYHVRVQFPLNAGRFLQGAVVRILSTSDPTLLASGLRRSYHQSQNCIGKAYSLRWQLWGGLTLRVASKLKAISIATRLGVCKDFG